MAMSSARYIHVRKPKLLGHTPEGAPVYEPALRPRNITGAQIRRAILKARAEIAAEERVVAE